MAKINIRLWRDYKLGKLNRNLTEEEQIEIEDCDFAMNLLLPTKSFVNLYKQLQNEGWSELQVFNILCMTFRVPADVVLVKLHEINNKEEVIDEIREVDDKTVKKTNIIVRGNLSFWKVYKMGKLNRELYPLEESRVEECDNAMNILVPNEIFIPLYNFLNEIGETYQRIITMLSIRFKVPTDIIEVKIYEYEKSRNNEINGPKLVK